MTPVVTQSRGGSVIARTTRLWLLVFLFLLIYDGSLRKWILPGAEQLVFIAKDVLLLGLLIYALSQRHDKINASIQPESKALFTLYAWWVLLEVANINLPNILVGIWGLKAHLLYASLIILIPLTFSNLDDLLRRLARAYPWIVVPVCTLAFAQLTAGTDSVINRQVTGGAEMIAHFGVAGLVRVTGTFSYISGMTAFVQLVAVLGIGLFLGGARSKSFLLGLGFSIAALPATGSRSVIAVVVVSAVMMLFAAWGSRLTSASVALRVIASIVVFGAISLQAQDAAWVALQERSQSAGETKGDSERVFTAFTNAFDKFDAAGILGFGSGATNNGAVGLVSNVRPFSWLPSDVEFEEESGRIVLELGIFGWFISQAMRVAFFLWALNLVRKGRMRTVRLAAVIALPTMALGMYQGSGVFATPIGATYYWFCVALLSMAHYEHRQDRLQQRARRSASLQTAVGNK